MLENLRRKSLVKTYKDLRHPINFEQGHVIYLDLFSFGQHKQKLSRERINGLFPSTFDGGSKEFRLISYTLRDVQFNMIYCPSGTFTMGHIDQTNNPPRLETIERLFLLGETEITQELYEKVMGNNGSKFKNPQNPVENVSWEDAILFCNELSRLQGLELCYTKNPKSLDFRWDCDFSKNGYRLPKEKEWEYAAKAGTKNKYVGTDNDNDLGKYAWFGEDQDIGSTHPVATKLPNEWGFYDMGGNVSEWCWDKYNPNSKKFSNYRVLRGSSWFGNDVTLRSAHRIASKPSDLLFNKGFRVCRSVVNWAIFSFYLWCSLKTLLR